MLFSRKITTFVAKMYNMRQKVFKSDVESLLKKGLAIVEETPVSRYYLRVAAVNAVLSGNSSAQAAKWFGVSSRTLNGWVKKVDEHGFTSLIDKSRPGAPQRLNKSQLEELDKMIQCNPADYGCKVWDGPSLSMVIKQTFGVNLGVRQCQRLFHKLNFSKIRPQTYPSKDCDQTEERKAFQKKEPK